MSQHDYDIASGSGVTVRADMNAVFAAIVSQNSGATEPTTTFAYQLWADTTTGILKQRNAANDGWVNLLTMSTGVVAATVPVAKGGTGATDAGAARTNLGLAIGTDVLAPDGDGSSLTGTRARCKHISTTHDISTATGSTAISGVGFTPVGFVMVATLNGGDAGHATWIIGDFTTKRGIYQIQSSGSWSYGSGGRLYSGASDYVDLSLSTPGADGCSLDYTKAGSATGTAYIGITFFG